MISRIIISLKRAASSQKLRMDPEVPTGLPTSLRDDYSSRAAEGIQLAVLKTERV